MGPAKRTFTTGIGAFLWLLVATATPLSAGEEEAVRRHVIALYDGDLVPKGDYDPVHEQYELALNHLGLIADRYDIRKGPPPQEALKRAGAILTAFAHTEKPCLWLLPWIERAVDDHGLRVVHLGDFGPLIRDAKGRPQHERLEAWLTKLGLGYDHYFTDAPGIVEVEFLEKKYCAFEASPMSTLTHRGPWNKSEKNHVWVRTRARGDPHPERHPVITGPWGGIALEPWTLRAGIGEGDRRWFLDLFRFFRDAFGMRRVPAPHPSVLNGRRMFFLQVDGDGFEDLSTIRPGVYSAKVFLDEILQRYQLPYTVSVIVRSLTDDYLVKEPTKRMLLAREILNLPHVEPASHGVLHTLRWRENLTPKTPFRRLMWYARLKNYEYSQVAEVRDSIRFVNERLMEPGRKCEVMLWTGSANPWANAVRESVRGGCWNVNGGIFRWDPLFDSVGYVSPWGYVQEDTVQVYAGAANENVFDGFYDTMPGAFRQIDTTIERTGKDRILKPADIYVHFYSADTRARLASLHYLIRRWAFLEETAPVFASTYARAVHSALTAAHVSRTSEGWTLRDFGGCRTVRIDDEARMVDWSRSKGILGSRRMGGSLYIHLAAPDAALVLTRSPRPQPHVEQANHVLADVRMDARGISFLSTSHAARLIRFAGFPPNAVVLQILDGKRSTVHATEQGRLAIDLRSPGSTRVEVRLP